MNLHPLGRIAEPIGSSTEEPPSAVDDPRVAAALDEYLAELQAGKRPSREEFLDRHPEIADALDRGLDVLEFLHSTAGSTAAPHTGPPAGDALPSDTILGDYCLIREVGRGGMGVVYEARQISLGRRVAVKVLSGAGVLDPRRLQRFQIEAQAVAQLNHAHIVPIFAVGHDRGIHFYAMQYVEGCTLAQILENHPGRRHEGAAATTVVPGGAISDSSSGGSAGASTPEGLSPASNESSFRLTPPDSGTNLTPFPSRDAFRAIARLAIQAAEGLDHAHGVGILHRDIKPSNLLVDTRGSLWITDFGLARFQDDTGPTITGDLVGTLRYMAPELAMGRRMSFDPRSDIYALGATLYELLTLRPVFSGSDRRELLRQITQDEPVSPRRIDRAIPRDLETIVMKAMAKEPERRYASARDLADDLDRFLTDQPIKARPPSPWERIAKLAHRHRAVLLVAASVALVALGIGGGLVWQEQQRTASAKSDLVETVRLLSLADGLTYSGMGKWAMSRTAEEQPEKLRFDHQALEFYDRLAHKPSLDPRLQALALHRLAFTRMVTSSGLPAEEYYRRSIALYESLVAAKPGDDEVRAGLADTYYNLGILLIYSPGGLGKAEPPLRRAIQITEERVVENRDPDLLEQLAGYRLQLATWLEQNKRPVEAERERRAVIDLFARLTAPVTAKDQSAGWAAILYENLATEMAQYQRTQEQETALRRGLTFVPDHAGLLSSLASLLAFRTDADRDIQAEAVAVARKSVDGMRQNPRSWRVLALAHLHAHDPKSATEAVDQALKQQGNQGRVSDWLLTAMIRYDQGRREEARKWYDRAVKAIAHKVNDMDAGSNLAESFKYLVEADRRMKPILEEERIAGDPGKTP